jgi:hypothetical protein
MSSGRSRIQYWRFLGTRTDAPRYAWAAETADRPPWPKFRIPKAVESQGANLNSPSLVDILWNQKKESPEKSYISLNYQKQRFQASD